MYVIGDLVSGVIIADSTAGVTRTSPNQQNDFTIDALATGGDGTELGANTKIFINGVEEKIHTSCSVDFIAGEPAPLSDPKGDPSANWFVVDFTQK